MIPEIVSRLPADQVNSESMQKQKQPDGTYDAIRVGRDGLVLARDWLDRELGAQRRIILGRSAVTIQAAYRACFNRMEYDRESGAWNIQACLRTVNVQKPYREKRQAVLQLMSTLHDFTGRTLAGRANESANLQAARNEMNAFEEDNKRLEKMEADERKTAAGEDEYSWRLMDATFGERVAADKQQYLSMAEAAYGKAKDKITDVKSFIDQIQKKGAESDARWQKMQTEGVVRAVPLVRQYKSEAAPFQPPSKDSYRFKYSFSYKGAKPVIGKANPPPPAE